MCGERSRIVHVEDNVPKNDILVKVYSCLTCGTRLVDRPIPVGLYSTHYYNQFGPCALEDKGMEHNVDCMTQRVKRGSFLDVGCGVGIALKLMYDKGFSVAGFDEFNGLRGVGEPFKNNIEINADLRKVAFGQFDCIQMREVFEHLTDPVGYLKWCYDHLNKEGWLFIQTPSAGSSYNPGRFGVGHYFNPSVEQLWRVLRQLGFAKVELISVDDACLYVGCRK